MISVNELKIVSLDLMENSLKKMSFCTILFTGTSSYMTAEVFPLLLKGEYHGNNPEMSKLLHKAVRQKLESAYSVYQQHLANRPVNVS